MCSVGKSLDGGLAAAGESERRVLLDALLVQHRDRLVRMVDMRLHAQVRARVDASDVVQEACLDASLRLGEYVRDPQVPFFVWLRRLTGQRLLKAHRFHLDAKRRDVRRQEREAPAMPDVSVVAIVDRLAGVFTSPTEGVERTELRERVAALLAEMGEIDRDVLCMRHFEELSNDEVAYELGIGKHAASKRYIRALRRLREQVGDGQAPRE